MKRGDTKTGQAKLTPKQAAFCAEYLIDLNATQAAIRAGYSAKTAGQMGDENLRKPEIQAEVSRLMADRGQKNEITADRVIQELASMAFYDPGQLADVTRDATDEEVENSGDDGPVKDGKITHGINRPQDIRHLPESIRRAIVGWSWDRAGNFTIKLASKEKALELIGRHLGMFRERVEITGKDGKPIQSETAHVISPELEEKILERTAAAARIAANVEPPASFRGQGREE